MTIDRKSRDMSSGHQILSRVSAFARLGNLTIYHYMVPVAVSWSLLGQEDAFSARTITFIVLIAVTAKLVAIGGTSLDDAQGYHDGIDQVTYSHGEDGDHGVAARVAMRGNERILGQVHTKPILSGEITEDEAYRFGKATAALGVVLGLAVFAFVAQSTPWWAWLAFLVIAIAGAQYSWGLKLSYHGAGELLLAAIAFNTVLLPYAALTGRATGTSVLEAALAGFWFAQVTLFSSSADVEGDRAANRMTLAARLSTRANKTLIACVFVAGWALAGLGVAVHVLPPVVLLALIPCWIVEIRQLVEGLGRSRWLTARFWGWRAFEAGLAGLVVANILS